MNDTKTTVLLIEDNPGDARLIREQLAEAESIQFRMEWAESLAAGLAPLNRGDIDVVLVDLGLPDSQGLDTLMRLKASTTNTPIIVLTGLNDKKLALEALRAGAQDYLVKGQVNSDALERIIRYAIERKKVEHKLLASETRYRRLFESAKDGILILEADTGEIVDVNPFLVDMLGYSHTEFLGKQLWEIGLFKDIVANKDAFLKLQEKGYIRYENLPLQTKVGQAIWVEFVSNSYLVDGKRVIQCNIRDITSRKQAEEALALSEGRFRKVFDEGPIGTALSDKQYHFVQANTVFCRLFGYTEQELKKLSFKDITHPEDLESSAENVRELEKGKLSVYKTEKRYLTKNKDIIWGALTLSTNS